MSRHTRTAALLRHALAEDALRNMPAGALLGRYVAAADEAAFAVLVRRYGGLVLRAARAVLPDDLADEVFQETFLKLVAEARAGRVPAAVGPWLGRVARRTALNITRREQRTADRQTRAAVPEAAAHESGDGETGPAIRGAVDGLPEKYRRVLELVYFDGLTHAEAADVLGKPKGTVDSLVKRGMDRLRGPLARVGVPAVALGTAAAPVPGAWVERLTAAAGLVPAARVGWLATGVRVTAVAAALVGGVGGAAVALKPSPRVPPADRPAEPTASIATLEQDNLRRLHAVAPELLAALRPLAFGGEVELVAAEAFDTRVRATVELRNRSGLSPLGPAGRVMLVADTHGRQSWLYFDERADGRWRGVDPARPVRIGLFGQERFLDLRLEPVEAAVAVVGGLPADPRGPAEAARRDDRARAAAGDFLGPWLEGGRPADPRDCRLGPAGIEFRKVGWGEPAVWWVCGYAAMSPPGPGRLRALDEHGVASMVRLSADGRRVELLFAANVWWSRPPGWRPDRE